MYTPDQLEEELEMAARIYCNDDVFVKIHGKDKYESDIILSQTFGWYRSDYTGNKRKDAILLSTIAQYLENYKASVKHSIRHVKTLQFRSISWATNAIHFSPYDKRSIVAEVKGFEKLMQRFVIAKPPENEELRLATLHSLNILDTLPEERFDRITKMVQEELQVPLVFVTYIDAIRQWMKSAQRPPSAPAVLEIPREVSFCSHTIRKGFDDVLIVENALEDERFVDYPLVRDFHVRFYAGCNLSVPSLEGSETVNLGTLCLLDFEPHKFDVGRIRILKKYASQVKREILRRQEEIGPLP